MHVEQFVMAYKVEQDRIRAILPNRIQFAEAGDEDQYRNTALGSENLYMWSLILL